MLKSLFVASLCSCLAAASAADADCAAAGSFPLDQTFVSLDGCGALSETCRTADELLFRYSESAEDVPGVLTVGIQSSPWRFYGEGYRILSPTALADALRGSLGPDIRLVRLEASWSGFVPEGRTTSLAQEVSRLLTGVDVAGADGFVWFTPQGLGRVTRQGHTGLRGLVYMARPGDEVMAAAATYVAPQMRDHLPPEAHGEFLLRQGVGQDVFGLCPEYALTAFQEAAAAGNVVGAYNAAVMLLERNGEGDRERPLALLSDAAETGDQASGDLLARTTAL